MTENEKDQIFLANSKKILDRSIDAIDTDTAARLRQIRYQALAKKRTRFSWLTPYSAFAATTAVVILSVTVWLTQLSEINDELVLEDLPMLTSTEELDFYQDLEFYSWLDDEKING